VAEGGTVVAEGATSVAEGGTEVAEGVRVAIDVGDLVNVTVRVAEGM
jgi:hypothetical protein